MHSGNNFGYTLYGASGVLETASPFHVAAADSGSISVDEDIERIVLQTYSNHGLTLFINVTKNGVIRNYRCTNCCKLDTSTNQCSGLDTEEKMLDHILFDRNIYANCVNCEINPARCLSSCEFVFSK